MATLAEITIELEGFIERVENWIESVHRLAVEDDDYQRQPIDGSHARYYAEKRSLAALAKREGIAEAVREHGEWLCRQLSYDETWPIRKLMQYAGEGDEGATALLEHWPAKIRPDLDRLVVRYAEHSAAINQSDAPTNTTAEATPPAENGQGFSSGDLCIAFNCSDTALRRYRDGANIKALGSRGDKYPAESAHAIARYAAESSDTTIAANAKRFISQHFPDTLPTSRH